MSQASQTHPPAEGSGIAVVPEWLAQVVEYEQDAVRFASRARVLLANLAALAVPMSVDHYRRAGDGVHQLMVHGSLENARAWADSLGVELTHNYIPSKPNGAFEELVADPIVDGIRVQLRGLAILLSDEWKARQAQGATAEGGAE